ncbi:unnamed protein product, partial [Symbiodinium necroappetens]
MALGVQDLGLTESSKRKKRHQVKKKKKEKSRSKKDKKERNGKLREGLGSVLNSEANCLMQRKAAGAWKREFVAQRSVRFQAASPQTKFGASMLGPSEGGTSLAHNWVAMSRASASAEALGDVLDDVIVPLFASAEEAFQSLPARYASFSEASLPVDLVERHAALSALAEIATGFSPAELGFFARSLELALLERRKGQEVTAGPTPPTRARPLFPDAPMPTPPSAKPPAPPPPAAIRAIPAPPKPQAPAPATIGAIPPKASTPSSAPPSGAHPELPKDSSPGPKSPEPERKGLVPDKADAEAADKVYELCRALAEKPCQVDGRLQADNVRQFVRDLLAVASQPLHWEEAWSRMGLPESLRSEAGSAFLSNLLEFASAPVGADLDDAARVSAAAIAALSKGHRLKMSQVEDFLIKRLDSDDSRDPQLWKVLSWLLFHWFPQGKTAGWGWWRVGWSWSQ